MSGRHPPTGTLLGFDFGDRRIGVAVGETITASCRPLVTLQSRNSRPDWEGIEALIRTWKPVALVVGLPFHLDGSEHPFTARARRFGNQLRGRYNLPVHWADERLTSVEAESRLGGRPARKGDIDREAAALILQSWLDENA